MHDHGKLEDDMTNDETTTTTRRKANPPRNTARRMAGYGRVSRVAGRDRDDRLRSPDDQRALMQRFAASEGIVLDEVVVELDQSGSKTDQSAELERLIQRVERGELDGIVVPRLNRLSRLKPRQRVQLVERIGSERILSATESNDVATPEGRMVRELFFILARMEWEQKADGFENAKAAAIAAGVAVTKTAAFGLAFDESHRYVPAPEAGTLRELMEIRAGGGSFNEVAHRFEERTGRTSSASTMAAMLSNRVYLGELRHGAHVNLEAHDAIVPLELFEAVQAVNEARSPKIGRGRWSGRRTTLLAGIAKCACCGAGLSRSTSNQGASVVYRCPTPSRKCAARASISVAELDAYVLEQVVAWIGPSVDELVEVAVELDARGERIVVEHRLEQARAALVAWAENVEAELEDAGAYRAGLSARERLVGRLELELEACDELSAVETARGTLRAALLAGELEDGEPVDVEERRELLATVLEQVSVRKTPHFGAPASERASLAFANATDRVLAQDSSPLLAETIA